MPARWGIRARLSALFAVALIATAAGALALSYLLLSRVLSDQVVDIGPLVQDVAPSTDPAAAARYKAQLARAADQVRRQVRANTLSALSRQLVPVEVGIVVVGIWGGWLLAGHTLRPLEVITRQTRRAIGSGSHQPIATPGPRDELHDLAETMDDLLTRLERATDGQWRFVANASHELKTPLAINRTLLEVAMRRPDAPEQLRQLGETLLEVNNRHERLIEGLLTLARSEHAAVGQVPVDLAGVLERASAALRADAHRAGICVTVDAASAPVCGDPALLERLATNLLQNAVRYNVGDGWVNARTGRDEGAVVLQVQNSGPEILTSEVSDLFEPFRRLHDRVGAADGSGLGLSIVRSIVRAHRGEVSAIPRSGGGLTVEVRLPAADR